MTRRKFSIFNFQFSILFLVFSIGLLVLPGQALAATLSLSPSAGVFNTSCNFSLDVVVDTEGIQTDGTDAILFFDTSKLTALNITSGTIYPDFPGNNIDATAGKITISGLASVSSPFSGKGTLATLNFSVKSNASTGLTQVTFDFDPNNKAKTTDSNIVQRGTVVDVLNSVVNGSYTIGTGACVAVPVPSILPVTGGPTGTATPTAQPIPVKTLPPAGSEQFTFTVAIVGSVLTVLGILGLVLL